MTNFKTFKARSSIFNKVAHTPRGAMVDMTVQELEAYMNWKYLEGEVAMITEKRMQDNWRPLIKTEIKDNHGSVGTVVYSLNGSPARMFFMQMKGYVGGKFLNSNFKPIRMTDTAICVKE